MLITLQHCTKQTTTRNKNTNRTTTKKDRKHFRLACLHDSVKRRARGTKKKRKNVRKQVSGNTRNSEMCFPASLSSLCSCHSCATSFSNGKGKSVLLPSSILVRCTYSFITNPEGTWKEGKERTVDTGKSGCTNCLEKATANQNDNCVVSIKAA